MAAGAIGPARPVERPSRLRLGVAIARAFFDAKLGVVGAAFSGSGPFVLITEDGGSNWRFG